jgi:hypothetical protein
MLARPRLVTGSVKHTIALNKAIIRLFEEAARELGVDQSDEAFETVVNKIAHAPKLTKRTDKRACSTPSRRKAVAIPLRLGSAHQSKSIARSSMISKTAHTAPPRA